MKSIGISAGLVSIAMLAASGSYVMAGCGSCAVTADKKGAACATAAEKKGAACAVAADKCAVKCAVKCEATVNTAALKAMLSAKVAVTVLDARSGKYDDGRRIPGAKALNAGSSEAEVAKTVPDKNGLVITYCSGPACRASNQLAEHLRKAGYTNVIEYPEGIAGWADGGNAVETAKKGEAAQ